MAKSPYDQVPYRTFPRRQTHPERLAAVGRLFGMTPAPVTAVPCARNRLRVGREPGAAGLCFAGQPIPGNRSGPAAGCRGVQNRGGAGAENCRYHVLDFSDLRLADGPFDYILAHGTTRGFRRRCATDCLRCAARCSRPRESRSSATTRIRARAATNAARHAVVPEGTVGQCTLLPDTPCGTRRRRRWPIRPDRYSVPRHPIGRAYRPVWFHQFVSHARSHGLRYLGESHPHEMFDECGRLIDEAAKRIWISAKSAASARRYCAAAMGRYGAKLYRNRWRVPVLEEPARKTHPR